MYACHSICKTINLIHLQSPIMRLRCQWLVAKSLATLIGDRSWSWSRVCLKVTCSSCSTLLLLLSSVFSGSPRSCCRRGWLVWLERPRAATCQYHISGCRLHANIWKCLHVSHSLICNTSYLKNTPLSWGNINDIICVSPYPVFVQLNNILNSINSQCQSIVLIVLF